MLSYSDVRTGSSATQVGLIIFDNSVEKNGKHLMSSVYMKTQMGLGEACTAIHYENLLHLSGPAEEMKINGATTPLIALYFVIGLSLSNRFLV